MRFYKIFFLLVFVNVYSQVETHLTSDNIMIGDTVGLQLEIKANRQYNVELPVIKDSLSKYVEVLAQKYDTISLGKDLIYRQNLTLTCFEPGEFLIKALPVKINGKTFLSATKELKVLDLKVDTSIKKMYPIKPILPEYLTWWDRNKKYLSYMVIGILIILVVLIIIWLYLREMKRKRYISSPLLPPYEEAIENLKKLDKKSYLESKDYYTFHTDLSFILRRYFSRRFDFPAQALLSSDLAKVMEDKDYITDFEARELISFLNDSDHIKYAKGEIKEEKHKQYRVWVEKIINKTRPIVEEEVKDHI